MLKELIDINENNDIVIIVRNKYLNNKYFDNKKSLENLLLKILRGEKK